MVSAGLEPNGHDMSCPYIFCFYLLICIGIRRYKQINLFSGLT
jgi:hypothetical protein